MSRRRGVSGVPIVVSVLALLSMIACSNAASTDQDVGSSRVWVEGIVVYQATLQPVINERLTFKVPLPRNDCGSARFGSVYSDPYDVRTDSLGRFGAEVTAFGFDTGIYCVLATAMNTTIRQPGVRFRWLGDRNMDTLTLRIEVP